MTDAPAPTAALPSHWSRLHALSPLLRSARAVAALGTVLGSRQLAPGQHQSAWVDLVVLAVATTAGIISWLVTRWRIAGSELQIETGFVRRQSVRVPLRRLQAVDVVRPLLARMLGLAEVRLVVAGQGTSHARLAYLTEARAAQVRASLLALAHGLHADTPEPAARALIAVPPRRVVVANLLTPGPLLVILAILATVTVLVTDPTVGAALFGSTAAIGLALALAAARQIGAEWDFTVAEAPDGLRLTSGLLQTRAETIPYGRAQAVRWVEPLLWRPLGWVRLEIDVARRHDRDRTENESATNTRALLPVGHRDDAMALLAKVLPNATINPPAGTRAPRRTRLRAPLLQHNLKAWYDANYIACMSGRVRRSIVVVPLEKVQSLRWTQGPVSRRLHLASVHADTAGRRFPATARYRDAGEAAAWIVALPDIARAARKAQRTRTG
ncbi:MAG TPA: PH domain-containing protein [Mycobacteriales bacterium]|nr:PH domain-containing protein [Mycobacteriales bacterium]